MRYFSLSVFASPSLFAYAVAAMALSACSDKGKFGDGRCNDEAIKSYNHILALGERSSKLPDGSPEACAAEKEYNQTARAFVSSFGSDFSCSAENAVTYKSIDLRSADVSNIVKRSNEVLAADCGTTAP